ncbi:hypothetical protein F3J28_00545 [Enterobacter sp. Ap-1006]|uniref:hypothetical protein n=1 Tax=Enterobacter sp. Ap-1006 TaxID=2608345 RepID=UPI001421A3EC|nr:hypothetical protein [Enterobacter sp. Ap-1006]NIF46254.1 hypothetical protein [Enterobacter sp. Ap-1006]
MMDNRHNEPDARFYPLNHDPVATNMLIRRNLIGHIFSPRYPGEVRAQMIADAERAGFTWSLGRQRFVAAA